LFRIDEAELRVGDDANYLQALELLSCSYTEVATDYGLAAQQPGQRLADKRD
jgi:hypothetical protein